MIKLYLKSGEIIHLQIEELEDFLVANKDQIQIRKLERRGLGRRTLTLTSSPA